MGNPTYTILLDTYVYITGFITPFLRHSILNIHHKAMKLCIHKGCL